MLISFDGLRPDFGRRCVRTPACAFFSFVSEGSVDAQSRIGFAPTFPEPIMPDHNDSSTDLRRRTAHHRRLRADAEGARAVMLDERSNALVTLTDDEMAEFDDEMARLARVVDRADAHLALLQPALAAAEAAEAGVDERATAAAMAVQDKATIASTARAFGGGAAAVVSSQLKAAALPERPTNPKIFDLPVPRVARNDSEWWAARDAKERSKREQRLRAMSGEPAPADR